MRWLAAALALVALTGCGRAGPPRQPGPKSEIIFPRQYPAPEPSIQPGAAPLRSGPAPAQAPPPLVVGPNLR